MSGTHAAARPICDREHVVQREMQDELDTRPGLTTALKPEDDPLSRLVELGSLILDSSIASILLVNPVRQWIHSQNQQLSIPDFERFVAVCATITPLGQPLSLPDIAHDARYEACVREHNLQALRFFARIPIRDRANVLIGSLSIASFVRKRRFTAREDKILSRLCAAISETAVTQRPHKRQQFIDRETSDRYALIARATVDGVWDWDIEQGTVYYSPRWQGLLGLAECDVTAGLNHWLDRVHPDDLSAVQEALEQNLRGQSSRFRSEHRIRHGDGSWRWIAVRGVAQRNAGNEPTRMAGSVADVTEERTSDRLTGLPNRLAFIDGASQLIERGKKHGLWHFAVLAIDIDRLAQFNERFGHACGDAVLRQIGDRLREIVSRTRIGEDSLVARFESDTFFVLLDGVKNASQAYGIADRIHTSIKQPVEYEHETLKVRAHIGIATARPGLCTSLQLLNNAELALSRAKSARNASTIVLTSSIEQEASSRIELEESLLEALPLNQLTTYYQPQVNLRTGQLIGCEALVRWNHPKRGLLQPREFIQLSEEMGLISLIDSWVLKSACRQLAEWRSLYQLSDFTMSVNISSHSLAKRGLKAEVEELLSRYSIPAGSLCLELTESVMVQENSSGVRLMQELREIGVRVSMDDFGIGYSSFKYLYELPFDALKIDATFMSHFPADLKARKVVEGILALAKTLGLLAVAEGIEDALQAHTLRAMGCKAGQGFLYDRPLAESRFREKYLVPAKRHYGIASVDLGRR